MKQGAILEAARRDGKGLLRVSLSALAVCVAMLGWNWKYVYNWFAGPFSFDAALSAAPGPREWVRAEGQLIKTGMVEETTWGVLRGLVKNTDVSAQYFMIVVDGRLLVVKVPPEFAGQVVEGRLVTLPEAVRVSFPEGTTPHPWLVDATIGYRWDFNLFVMIAGPLFPLLLILFLYALWRATSVDKHPALSGLRHLGPHQQVARRIETELAMAGQQARAGPIWLTSSWLVALTPTLLIHSAGNIIGLGHQTEAKQTVVKHFLRVWLRGKAVPKDLEMSAAEANTVIARAEVCVPGLIVTDADGFDRRWKEDRAKCEQEADRRLGRRRTA